MTDERAKKIEEAARVVAGMADSRHPWADAKSWWDAVTALRSALALPEPATGEFDPAQRPCASCSSGFWQDGYAAGVGAAARLAWEYAAPIDEDQYSKGWERCAKVLCGRIRALAPVDPPTSRLAGTIYKACPLCHLPTDAPAGTGGEPHRCTCGHDAGSHDYAAGYCRARRPSGSCGCKKFAKRDPSAPGPKEEP